MFDNQLKKQAHVRESILTFVAMIVVCYAGLSMFYQPRAEKNKELIKQVQEFEDRKTGTKKLIAALQQKIQEKGQEADNQIVQALENDPKVQLLKKSENAAFQNISDFLNAVARDASKPSLSVNSMKYDASQAMDGYLATHFTIHVSGHFGDLVEFIKVIEDKSALSAINKLHLLVDGNDSSKVALEIEGTFYQLRSNQDV